MLCLQQPPSCLAPLLFKCIPVQGPAGGANGEDNQDNVVLRLSATSASNLEVPTAAELSSSLPA